MKKDDPARSVLGVLLALVYAVLFALSFLWAYSPERLLAQCALAAFIVNGLRPLLDKLGGGTIRVTSAIAYFTTRVLMLAAIAVWFFTGAPQLFSKAMTHNGWTFAADVGFAVLLVVVLATALLLTLFGIVFPVWGNEFGRKAQDG